VDNGPEMGHLKGFFQALPDALPKLQRLYIGFWPFPAHWPSHGAFLEASPKEKYLVHTEQFLAPIDMLISEGLGDRLSELEIGTPTSALHAHFTRGVGLGDRFELPGMKPGGAVKVPPLPAGQAAWGPRRRTWRPVDHAGEERGYWLGATMDDMPDGWIATVPDDYWK
jgi:hypothetical protein